MRNKLISLVVVLVLLCFLVQQIIWLNQGSVNLRLELEQLNNNYINGALELDEMKGKLNYNTKHSLVQTEHPNSSRVNNSQIQTLSKSTQSKAMFDYRPPGKHHRYKLIDEITIDKFRIISEAGRNYYKVVYGIPTVARPQNKKYFIQTINSLFNDPVSIQQLNVLVIIFVADIDTDRCQEVVDIVMYDHYKSFRRGNIEVVCPNPTLYPSLNEVPTTLGDPEDRIKWRSKQNLDFGFLMWYASRKGEYYVQLEDDIIAAKDYAYHIDHHVDKVKDDFWFLIHFSIFGFIGKLMRSEDLLSFASYLLLFYSNQPCDWLVYDYGRSLVCYSGLDAESCNSLLDKIYTVYKPSLFQHMGTVSSLEGKTENAKDPLFKDAMTMPFEKPIYSNPPARINSTFSIYENYTVNILYEGKGYLWSYEILKGDYIVVEFIFPQELRGVIIRSSSIDNPQDKLEFGVVEFKTKENSDFEYWCEFKGGEANCSSSAVKLVNAIRVLVTEPQTHWLLITHFECLL